MSGLTEIEKYKERIKVLKQLIKDMTFDIEKYQKMIINLKELQEDE